MSTYKPRIVVDFDGVLHLDDRGLRFDGEWPDEAAIEDAAVPWYKRDD